MRTLTAPFLAAIAAQQSGEAVLFLLTMTHADFGTIRLVNDLKNIVSGGDTFIATAFSVALPAEVQDGIPDLTCVVDNTDLVLGAAFSQVQPRSARPAVTLEVILASSPNTIEASMEFEASQWADGDASLTLTLDHEPLLDEPFPGEMFTPSRFPSMFSGV